MRTPETDVPAVTTGLLSQAQREFLRGENQVENPESYIGNLRYRARNRTEQIEEDLALLEEHGHEDIANEFRQRYSEREQLRDEIQKLSDRLDEIDD